MKEVKYDNYIIIWNSTSDFQECSTLEQASTDIQDLINSGDASPSDIILYGCVEIELDITVSSNVDVKK